MLNSLIQAGKKLNFLTHLPVFRHGGHAGHIIQWFTEHVDCPVTGCTCKCAQLDPGL